MLYMGIPPHPFFLQINFMLLRVYNRIFFVFVPPLSLKNSCSLIIGWSLIYRILHKRWFLGDADFFWPISPHRRFCDNSGPPFTRPCVRLVSRRWGDVAAEAVRRIAWSPGKGRPGPGRPLSTAVLVTAN